MGLAIVRIELEQALYQAVLSAPNRYVAKVGHQHDGDNVVGRRDGYLILEPT